ncbi:MAG: hypothetical protein JOZ86_07695 [Candidatus Eremiobacteraeota bacterium]|nr:hypothetical protein [Candidatus Eremiobacteraeota bacterium]
MERRDDRIETVKEDARDALDEIKERAKAVGAHVKQVAHDMNADAHKARREARDTGEGV